MVFGIANLAQMVPAAPDSVPASPTILDTLGIDPKLLAFQAIAFLILVLLLGKFVFPVFVKIVDKRQAAIEQSNKAAMDANKHAEKAQEEIAAMLKSARAEASNIVGTAKDEANDLLARAESKSKAHAEAIVAAAKADIQKEVVAAKKALHNETINLVVAATEKVASAKISAQADESLIKDALEGAR